MGKKIGKFAKYCGKNSEILQFGHEKKKSGVFKNYHVERKILIIIIFFPHRILNMGIIQLQILRHSIPKILKNRLSVENFRYKNIAILDKWLPK